MRLIGRVILISVVMAMSSIAAFACDCVNKSDAESFATSDAVFIGEVVSVDRTTLNTTFAVHQWLKGKETNNVVVFSHGSNCDMWFYPESTYIVYATRFEGRLIASICSGTRTIGPPRFESRPILKCSTYLRSRNYGEIALITATCVAMSLGLGLLVGTIRKRFR